MHPAGEQVRTHEYGLPPSFPGRRPACLGVLALGITSVTAGTRTAC